MIDLNSPAGLGGAGVLAGQAEAGKLATQILMRQDQIARENALREQQLAMEQQRINNDAALRAQQLQQLDAYRQGSLGVKSDAIQAANQRAGDANGTRKYIADLNNKTKSDIANMRDDEFQQTYGLKKQQAEDLEHRYQNLDDNAKAMLDYRYRAMWQRAATAQDRLAVLRQRNNDIWNLSQQQEANKNARFNAGQQNLYNRAIASAQNMDARYNAGQLNQADRTEYIHDRNELNNLSSIKEADMSDDDKKRRDALLQKFATGKWSQGLVPHAPQSVAPPPPQTVAATPRGTARPTSEAAPAATATTGEPAPESSPASADAPSSPNTNLAPSITKMLGRQPLSQDDLRAVASYFTKYAGGSRKAAVQWLARYGYDPSGNPISK